MFDESCLDVAGDTKVGTHLIAKPFAVASFDIGQWGYEQEGQLPNMLAMHVAHIETLSSKRTGEILASITDKTLHSIEIMIANKPKEVRTLEWLSMQDMSIKAKINEVLAIQNRMPFLFSMHEFQTVGVAIEHNHAVFLQEYQAILVYNDNHPQVWFLVFAHYNQFLQYKQLSRFEIENHPIHQLVSSHGCKLVPALANADSVLERLTALLESIHETTVSGVVDENSVQFWEGASAVTSAQKSLASLFNLALTSNVTDIDFHPERDGSLLVYFRRFGNLTVPSGYRVLSAEVAPELIGFLLARSRANQGGARVWTPKDGQFVYRSNSGDVFLRCSFVPVDQGSEDALLSASIRLQPRTVSRITLEQLNVHPDTTRIIKKTVQSGRGLTLVVGPTNSGKSTTIAGIISEHIDLFGNTKKRISMEDPVERHIHGVKQIQVPSSQEDGFEETLRGLMRHDPDFIWVGEVRDKKTAHACIRAASSGHMVVSTLHANDAVLGIQEIANMVDVSRHFSLFESLNLVIAQRLVKHVCPNCSHEITHDAEMIDDIEYYCSMHGYQNVVPEKGRQANHDGCDKCSKGYVGVLPLMEVLPMTRQTKDYLISSLRDGFFEYKEVAKARKQSLFDDAIRLVREGKIELRDVLV